jgi:hypothetical protein
MRFGNQAAVCNSQTTMNFKRPLTMALLTAAIMATAAACGDDDNATTDTTNVVTAESTEPETNVPDSTEPSATAPDTTTPDGSAPPSSGLADCAAEPTDESADELLVGLTEDQATAAAEACGWILRVVHRDGEDLPVTLDLRPNRVNVEVTDGEVTAIVNIG